MRAVAARPTARWRGSSTATSTASSASRRSAPGAAARRGARGASPPGARRLGVWGADPRPGRGRARAAPVRDGDVGTGVKVFCSGAGGVDRALVTVRGRAARPLLAYVDVAGRRRDRPRAGTAASGMRTSESHRVRVPRRAACSRCSAGPGSWCASPGSPATRSAPPPAGRASPTRRRRGGARRRWRRGREPATCAALAAGPDRRARVATIDRWLDAAARRGRATRRPTCAPRSVQLRAAVADACRAIVDEAARGRRARGRSRPAATSTAAAATSTCSCCSTASTRWSRALGRARAGAPPVRTAHGRRVLRGALRRRARPVGLRARAPTSAASTTATLAALGGRALRPRRWRSAARSACSPPGSRRCATSCWRSTWRRPPSARARERLAAAPHVRVERRSVPEEMPGGPVRPDRLLRGPLLLGRAAAAGDGWRALRAALAPGGRLLAVHWRGPVRALPAAAATRCTAAVGARRGGLVHARSERPPTLSARPLGPPVTASVTRPLPPPDRSAARVRRRARPRRGGPRRPRASARSPRQDARAPRTRCEVLLVLDRCADATARRARRGGRARHAGLRLRMLDGEGRRGRAPRAGWGWRRVPSAWRRSGRPDGLIASTDADSEPAARLAGAVSSRLVAAGARAVGGLIEVDAGEAASPRRARRLRTRGSSARRPRGPRASADAEHPFFSGASLGVTAEAYRRGGRPRGPWRRSRTRRSSGAWRSAACRSCARAAVRVRTSAAPTAAPATAWRPTCALDDWARAGAVPRRRLRPATICSARKRETVSVVLPGPRGGGHDRPDPRRPGAAGARRPGGRAARRRRRLARRHGRGAAAQGARLVQESDVMPQLGPGRGKGDAMWRGLAATQRRRSSATWMPTPPTSALVRRGPAGARC